MERLYTVAMAATFLGRTEKAIRHLEKKGYLQRVCGPDRRVMFSERELQAFLSRRRQAPLRLAQ